MNARAPVYVNGEELQCELAPVHNPARTDEVVGQAALGTAEHVDVAVSAASRAFPAWRDLGCAARAACLLRAASRIESSLSGLPELLTREQGKVLWEARNDVAGAPMLLRYYAGLADRIDAMSAWSPLERAPGEKVGLRWIPKGPTGIITPWNTPVHLGFLALAPALMAGNTAIVKLPEVAPLTLGLVLRALADELPRGVVSIVPGLGHVAGQALASHPDVRHLCFTGSIATGKTIARVASGNLKSLSMELGGNDAAIVLDDVDITDELMSEFLAGTFSSSGQICYNVKRIYVAATRLEEFRSALVDAASTIVVGDGLKPNVTMGPVATPEGFDRLSTLVEQSRGNGARVDTVGSFDDEAEQDHGYFVRPSVVSDIAPDDPLVLAEQFGPVVPVIAYSNVEDAVAMANGTEYGLGASVWSADRERARSIAAELEAGSVFVNLHRVGASPVDVPFGGVKQSGTGRNHGMCGVESAMEVQAMAEFESTLDLPGGREWRRQLNLGATR